MQSRLPSGLWRGSTADGLQTLSKTDKVGESEEGATTFIYLDTMLWNRLCDDAVDAEKLMTALLKNNKQLVLGTEVIYEIAKTFRTNPARGQQLFTYLKTYTDRGILCTRDNPLILDCEAELVLSGESNECDPFFRSTKYRNMQEEVDKLSRGTFDERAQQGVESRMQLAASERAAMNGQYSIPSILKARLSIISSTALEQWLRKEVKRVGRILLKERLRVRFPEWNGKQLTIVAKKLLASSRCPLSRAVVRADLYANWRTAQSGSMTRDLLPDLDHVVTASYFDVYATMEAAQAKYAPLLLKNTRIAIYDGKVPVAEWLESL